MIYAFSGKNFSLEVSASEHGAEITGGSFGEVSLASVPFFQMRLKKIGSDESVRLNSLSSWGAVKVNKTGEKTEFCFEAPLGIKEIGVYVNALSYENGVNWTVEVRNNSDEYSVMDITYPTPKMLGKSLNYFYPQNCGLVVNDAETKGFEVAKYYGGWTCMQYCAVYGRKNGIYLGIEDGKAFAKFLRFGGANGYCYFDAEFPAIGAGLSKNSFKLAGKSNWRYLDGDWYDAAQIYSEFVRSEAEWLPEIGEHGREDLSERFKKVPFWIVDYIPNSEYQRDNKPKNLSAGSDIYEKDYWYKAPIAIQKKLGVPIAYHVYNWHEIPFNIEYPHYLPAKQDFKDHIKELQDNNVYVLPYINGIEWEKNDDEGEHDETFKNTGYKFATLKEDGSYVIGQYPQTTKSGKTSDLVHMCGCCEEWHERMEKITRRIETELNVDGIYYDEISASPIYPCYNKSHNHLPGGGNFWSSGYNSMLKKIRKNKPENNFYFSECNGESYMKNLDGYLTWMWVESGEVPAFSAVYAGYVQLLGCCTIGVKKEDFEFFKYCTAKSFLYGQQLGWCKADIVYSDKHMEFLTKIVKLRYDLTDLFNSSKMLRPPVIKTNLPKLVTTAGLWFKGNIVSEQVLGGAWKYRNGKKTVVFAINIAETSVEYSLSFKTAEYGLDRVKLPENFVKEKDYLKVTGSLDRYQIKIWEFDL